MIICAVIQMNSGANKAENLKVASKLINQASFMGANIVALPENFAYMRYSSTIKETVPETLDGKIITWGKKIAKKNKIYLLLGSFPEKSNIKEKVYNTSVLLDPEGEIVKIYRKIHLFDAYFEKVDDGIVESKLVVAGQKLALAETKFCNIGLTICYDLRFAEQYQKLTENDAKIIFAPSAFTLHTGKDHWEVLVRARAIENQIFMVAPAQQGLTPKNKLTYGHSMIVDPWGTVLARVADGEGIGIAEIDLKKIESIEKALPCKKHRVDISSFEL